jgi:arylsulfatase A-like enzyme
VLLSAALGGCAGDAAGDRPPVSIQRLAPILAPGAAPVPGERVVARWDVLAEPESWQYEAPQSETVPRADALGGDDRRVLRLSAERSDQMVRVIRDEPVDTREFNEVRLDVAFRGHGGVRVEFWRYGQVEWRTENIVVPADGRIHRIALGIPFRVRDRDPFERMSVRFDGNARAVDVRQIELISRSPASRAPDPATGPRLVLVGDDARLAMGVATDRPLLATGLVPTGGHLVFAAAQPHDLRRRLVGASLRVTIGDESGRTQQQRVHFERDGEDASRWHWSRVSLADFVGRSVTLRFEMETADGQPGACVLAEVAILAPGEARPMVLLVTTDTHRGDHIGLLSADGWLKTPVLDALAARGVLFEDCFAPTNSTNPSHAALMTGEHPRDVGVLNNVTSLLPSAPTIVQRFREAGYATWAALSTAHIGPETSGLGAGFERMSWPPHTPRRSGQTIRIVEDWLTERDGRPLFVWLHVFDAHWPYQPPEAFDRAYYPQAKDPFDPMLPGLDIQTAKWPADLIGLRDIEYPKAQYGAEVSSEDAELGRLLDDPRFAEAVIAVVGDHGESFGEHGIWFNHDGLYPQTLHVPLIVSWPGAPGGSRETVAVTHTDVGRTVLDLAGLGDAVFPGRNLLDRVGADAPRFALAMRATSASVTHGDLHLVLHLRAYALPAMSRGAEQHQVELYDLATDPEALLDVSAERPQDMRRLRARLIEWLGAARALGWAGRVTTDPTTVAELAELGYTNDTSPTPASLWIEDDCDWCRRAR